MMLEMFPPNGNYSISETGRLACSIDGCSTGGDALAEEMKVFFWTVMEDPPIEQRSGNSFEGENAENGERLLISSREHPTYRDDESGTSSV